MNKYKITLIGDGGVGKTTLVKKLQAGVFIKQYNPTLGVEEHPIVRKKNNETIVYNIWDTPGQEKFGGFRERYMIKSDAVIVMFDKTSLVTFNNTSDWIGSYQSVAPNTPIILCGNKCDITKQVVTIDMMNQDYMKRNNITYLDISAKTDYNIEKLFETLNNKLLENKLQNINDVVLDTTKPKYAMQDFPNFW